MKNGNIASSRDSISNHLSLLFVWYDMKKSLAQVLLAVLVRVTDVGYAFVTFSFENRVPGNNSGTFPQS